MLLTVTILLGVFLIVSIVFNVMLYKAGIRRLNEIEFLTDDVNLLSDWISEFKKDVLTTYNDMKLLDDKEMFSKDDDVGMIFDDMVELVTKLNDRTQEETE